MNTNKTGGSGITPVRNRGVCSRCGIWIDDLGRCACTTAPARRIDKSTVIFAAVIVLALFVPNLAHAAPSAMCYSGVGDDCRGADNVSSVYLPTIKQDIGRQWFVDSELSAAMNAANLPPAQYDEHTSCTLDATSTTEAVRYALCNVNVDEATGGNTRVFFWLRDGAMWWQAVTL